MQIKFYALEKSKLVLTDNPIKESLLHKYERERQRDRHVEEVTDYLASSVVSRTHGTPSAKGEWRSSIPSYRRG